MEFDLPSDLESFVSAKLATGGFRTIEEVAIAAMRTCRDAEQENLEELRAALQAAEAQIERGEGTTIQNQDELRTFFNDIRRAGDERAAVAARTQCS